MWHNQRENWCELFQTEQAPYGKLLLLNNMAQLEQVQLTQRTHPLVHLLQQMIRKNDGLFTSPHPPTRL